MGNGLIISNVNYNNLNDESKIKLFDEFKQIYSDKNKSELDIIVDRFTYQEICCHIFINEKKIVFNTKAQLFEFIGQLNRPFIYDKYNDNICFVYSLNKIL